MLGMLTLAKSFWTDRNHKLVGAGKPALFLMFDPTTHRASPRQWEALEKFILDCGYDSCLIDLRNRVEALEAQLQQKTQQLQNQQIRIMNQHSMNHD